MPHFRPAAAPGGARSVMPEGNLIVVLAVLATLATLVLLWSLIRGGSRRAASPTARVDRRRQRLRLQRGPQEALTLLGNALAATHDPRALLPVILEVTVEATRAEGGRLLEAGRELAWTGHTAGEQPLQLPLAPESSAGETVVVLHPPKGGFSREASELARWLVAQAAIALENAELHHVVQRQATTDELTGLANRRRFMEALEAEIERADRTALPLALVLADLDDFKRINDHFGHHVGDEALRRFATLLVAELRELDVAGRLGGEEFAVLLPETDLAGAAACAGRIRRSAAASSFAAPGGESIRLTASLGVAGHAGGSAEALLQWADAALYRAKAEGKNRVAVAGAV